ncbi:hypothetical protein NDU88_007478, partial [Pleurodeles waltl]
EEGAGTAALPPASRQLPSSSSLPPHSHPRSRLLGHPAPLSTRAPGPSMTLKSSKKEPVSAALESVGTMRTVLSDLYLEHLLQSKGRPE